MSDQTDLFERYRDAVFPSEPLTRREEIDQKFRKFHLENPEVWRLFCHFTFQLIRRGFQHYSADAVVHRIRWHTGVETTTAEVDFKIGNNWVACYARLFMITYPEHDGFFRTRERTSGRRPPMERAAL